MAKFNRRTARIIFEEDSILPGGEVVMNLDVNLDVVMYFRTVEYSDPEEERKALQRLASLITEWNIEDDADEPIAVDEDCLFKTPAAFGAMLLTKWMEAMTEVPVPLGKRSDDGNPPMPIPMVLVG